MTSESTFILFLLSLFLYVFVRFYKRSKNKKCINLLDNVKDLDVLNKRSPLVTLRRRKK